MAGGQIGSQYFQPHGRYAGLYFGRAESWADPVQTGPVGGVFRQIYLSLSAGFPEWNVPGKITF